MADNDYYCVITLLHQVYTLLKEDENTTKLMVVGYSVLNIFVESGTTEQPEKDDIASTVRLL